MTRLTLAIAMVLSLVLPSTAALAEASVQFNMLGVQAPKDPDVKGFRFVFLYGKNNHIGGFDLGFAAISESATRSGFHSNMGFSLVTGNSSGAALSLVNVHSGTDTGVNAAFINTVKTLESGVNLGFVNLTEGYSQVDIGGLSVSEKSDTQVGFINVTKEITNIQIGFLNFAENGFFPLFPFINFPKN